jgi:chromosome segregation ATPase
MNKPDTQTQITKLELQITKLKHQANKLTKDAERLTREAEIIQTHLADAATQYNLLRLELGEKSASKAQ